MAHSRELMTHDSAPGTGSHDDDIALDIATGPVVDPMDLSKPPRLVQDRWQADRGRGTRWLRGVEVNKLVEQSD
jgi:hypothetical protein